MVFCITYEREREEDSSSYFICIYTWFASLESSWEFIEFGGTNWACTYMLHISSESQSMEIKCFLKFKDTAVRSENNTGGNADNAGNDTAGGFIETFWDTLPESSPIAETRTRSRSAPDWWIIHQDRVQSSSRGCNKSRCSATRSRSTQGVLSSLLPADPFLFRFFCSYLGSSHRWSHVVSRAKTWIRLEPRRGQSVANGKVLMW